jgi:hypothetical protein
VAMPDIVDVAERRAPNRRRVRVFTWVAAFVALAAVFHLFVQLVVYPSAIYWLSYYVPTYEFGFVRRGLGGEIVRQLPEQAYFPATYTMMWAPVIAWFVALGALVWQILGGRSPSERRTMLAILVPVLPFSMSYALYTPRPELWAMAALVAYAIWLTGTRSARATLIASAAYGFVIAVLALVHEGIPLELALGAVLAVVVLPRQLSAAHQRLSAALAVGPGLVAVAVVAMFAKKNVGSLLCDRVPHRMLENPYAASNTPQQQIDYMLGRFESKSDYHDWMCTLGTPMVDSKPSDGLNLVISYGFGPLFASSVVGVLYFAVTMWAITAFAGVSVRGFLTDLRGKALLPVLGVLVMVPVFVTGVDWTRWWVLITFDVALVMVLRAIGRPEIDASPPTKTTMRVFVLLVVVLAIIPTGAALHIGGPNFQ